MVSHKEGDFRRADYLNRPKHLCSHQLKIGILKDLLQRHKHCRGLNRPILLGNGVPFKGLSSKRQPCSCKGSTQDIISKVETNPTYS